MVTLPSGISLARPWVGYHVENGTPSSHEHTLYAYDALGRRIVEGPTYVGTSIPSNVAGKDLYYSDQWQVIHEVNYIDTGGGGGFGGQNQGEGGPDGGLFEQQTNYIWSLAYVDALVLRDRDANLDGGLEQRLYVQQDANFNVTALIETDGDVAERFVYDPYGVVTVLDGDWSVDAGGSDYAWVYLHQGGRYEAESGLYHFRHRDYSPTLGRWVQQDPLKYVDGLNAYEYLRSNPRRFLDPSGEAIPACVAFGLGVGGALSAAGGGAIAISLTGLCMKCLSDIADDVLKFCNAPGVSGRAGLGFHHATGVTTH